MPDPAIQARLEYLRGEIEAERISYGEIAELESLAEHIDAGDTLLLQWANVPEHADDDAPTFPTAYAALSPFERWMVRSNLKTMRSTGATVAEQAAALRSNGYPRIAAAVEAMASA